MTECDGCLKDCFSKNINKPVSCLMIGGKCLGLGKGTPLKNGSCRVSYLTCCKIV
ncbi:beta-defensin 5-like [Mus caroli]|uniref:Beta-defensin 5-like n=1 Tax=Mus caroli TaxID=10089 RepID=A0A6P5P7H0_MUSCR|nr:beta-defensin 5-like [Mus caroli]